MASSNGARLTKHVSQHKSSPSLSYTVSPITRTVRFPVESVAALPVLDVEEKVTGPISAPSKPPIHTQIKPANLSLHMGRLQVQALHLDLVQVLAHVSSVARLVTGHMIVLAKGIVPKNILDARPFLWGKITSIFWAYFEKKRNSEDKYDASDIFLWLNGICGVC